VRGVARFCRSSRRPFGRDEPVDTLTAFGEPVESLGRCECIDGRLKSVLLEMLSDELDVAMETLETTVLREDEELREGIHNPSTMRDANLWTAAVSHIVGLGERVLATRSCGAEPPADMMKRWREMFEPERAYTARDIITP